MEKTEIKNAGSLRTEGEKLERIRKKYRWFFGVPVRGRPALSPEEKAERARKRFDERHGKDRTDLFLGDCLMLSLKELKQKWGLKSREYARLLYLILTGEKSKPQPLLFSKSRYLDRKRAA